MCSHDHAPVCELGLVFDAKDASENAKKPEIFYWYRLYLDRGIMVLLGFVKGLVG